MSRFIYLMFFTTCLCGCSDSKLEVATEQTWQVAYDQKSKQAYSVSTKVELPAPNPENEKSKLLPAWYCESCQKWYPIPPLEQFNRSKGAGLCPKDGQHLTPTGPQPDKSLKIESGAD